MPDRFFRFVAGFVALALAPFYAACHGGDFDAGQKAYDSGDFARAVDEWTPLAEKGDARAQHLLATLYEEGKGVKSDFSQAIAWHRKAAQGGIVAAQLRLGQLYDEGKGAPRNYAEASRWYQAATQHGDKSALDWFVGHAGQGDPACQYLLGMFYADGAGVPANPEESLKWFRKSAEQGDPNGQFELGKSYAIGRGTKPNYVQAYLWSSLAAAQNNAEAAPLRDKLAENMTPREIHQAQVLAGKWKPAR